MERLIENFNKLSNLPFARLIALMVGMSLSIAVGVGVVLWSTEEDYTVLFADISAEEASEVINSLDSLSVPYRIDSRTGMISVPAQGASFALPIGDVIDVDAETARLEKNAAKTRKDADGLRKRLDNPKFVENADFEVIEAIHARQVEQVLAAVRVGGAVEHEPRAQLLEERLHLVRLEVLVRVDARVGEHGVRLAHPLRSLRAARLWCGEFSCIPSAPR